MSSPAQAAANAANAQLSTGPRTPDGKARSAQNARTHGLTSHDVVIQPGEEEHFEAMLRGFQADIQPYGQVQQALFDDMVAAAWNLHRIRRMEVDLAAGHSNIDLMADEETQKKLDRLLRHKAHNQCTYSRCLKELKALQTDTVIAATLPTMVCDALPGLASANEITKRTQKFTILGEERHLAMRIHTLREGPEREKVGYLQSHRKKVAAADSV